jgi:hypothetical protein
MDGRMLRARTKIEAFVGSLHKDVQQERRAVWVRRLCALCCERKQRITIEFVLTELLLARPTSEI